MSIFQSEWSGVELRSGSGQGEVNVKVMAKVKVGHGGEVIR